MLTAEQHATRRGYLTASDLAAVMGLDPFKKPADVWRTKKLDVEPDDGNEATTLGNEFETPLINFAARRVGAKVESQQTFCVSPGGIVAATIDGILSTGDNVEAKSAGLVNPYADLSEWGEEGTDQVPRRVIVQVHAQFVCRPSARTCWVPALLGRGLQLFRIDRNEELCGFVEAQATELWERHMLADEPAADAEPPSLDVLKRIRRQPKATIPIDGELVARWNELRTQRLEMEKIEEVAYRAVVDALGQAEAGEFEGGLVTYYPQIANRISTSRVRTEYPEVAAACMEASTSRVLRMKKGGGA